MNEEEKRELFTKLGFPHDWYNGERRWLSGPAPDALVAIIDGDYLGTDLATVAGLAGLSVELFDALKEDQTARIAALRLAGYTTESDGLFFKEQAGEVPAGTWQAKRTEIRGRYPYPGAG